ncbi:MAG: ATP-dependent 6-phosphofructokinase [Pirellulaceae bacterium]
MRIGVFCSGGDAPGMNACVRAVVRTARASRHDVIGIRRGYQGLLEEDFHIGTDGSPLMTQRDVSGWGRHGGAFLRSSRSEEFRSAAGQQKALDVLEKHNIDALIPIGGDGTFRGATDLVRQWDGKVIGCPGTIDNDLVGTDCTIGFSTAVQTAVEAVDKIRDTAESHERMFLIEVMGRHSGYIALFTAVAAGAEVVCLPESVGSIAVLVDQLNVMKNRQKDSILLVVSEGDEGGGAEKIQQQLESAGCPFPMQSVILGHLQRGGTPSPEDRILASQLGYWAVVSLEEGHMGAMVGSIAGQRVLTPFAQTSGGKTLPPSLMELIGVMAH